MKKEKLTRKEQREEKRRKRNNLIVGLVMLFLMVFSLVGFALTGSTSPTSSNQELPDNLPLQQFTDPGSGTVFWGAIVNGEQFVFFDIEQYAGRDDLEALSNQMRAQTGVVDLFVDGNFSDGNSLFLVERSFSALQIPTQRIANFTCAPNTFIFTNNKNLTGDCMIFAFENSEAPLNAEGLAYYIVR